VFDDLRVAAHAKGLAFPATDRYSQKDIERLFARLRRRGNCVVFPTRSRAALYGNEPSLKLHLQNKQEVTVPRVYYEICNGELAGTERLKRTCSTKECVLHYKVVTWPYD
jgi:hypothetical protein